MTAKQPAAATATAPRVQPSSLLQRRLPVSGPALAAGPAPRPLARSSSPLPPGEGPGVRAALPTTLSVPAPLLSAPITLQPKLTVNTPGDKYEQEADRVADMVMRIPDPMVSRAAAGAVPVTASDGKKKRVQRQCATCAAKGHTSEYCPECTKKKQGPGSTLQSQPILQRHSTLGDSSAGMPAPPSVHTVLATPGEPLDQATRDFFEPRFGRDLSKVRIHTDTAASSSAADVQARAYTVGNHIVFAAGEQSSNSSGRQLMSHELAHVFQQGGHLEGRDNADTLRRAVSNKCFAPSVLYSPAAAVGFGIIAEKFIELDFDATSGVGTADRYFDDSFAGPVDPNYVDFLVKKNPGLTVTQRLLLEGLSVARPDILADNLTIQEFFEIKPDSPDGRYAGNIKLAAIKAYLRRFKLPYNKGTGYTPTSPIPILSTIVAGLPVNVSLEVRRAADGLLVYKLCIETDWLLVTEAILMAILIAIVVILSRGRVPIPAPGAIPIPALALDNTQSRPDSEPIDLSAESSA